MTDQVEVERAPARVVVAGEAEGEVVHLTEPLSFWGGFDPVSGRVIDVHHPQNRQRVDGRVVVMESSRGSSSASSVIVEAARRATNPAALVVLVCDQIVSTGAIVADELYRRRLPIIEVDEATFALCASAKSIAINAAGTLSIVGAPTS